MSAANWIDHELKNWGRWCNSGPSDEPQAPGSCLGNLYIRDELTRSADDDAPPPIHEENAKRVQKVFDVAATLERKVMQAEYLSPWRYGRYSGGVAAAARALEISTPSYETILTVVKRRVERVFT
ncbi:hypothetical protein [Paraburkholderia atlantica]|uniref:hypothetical protein n=1 Tax=Paraburkholderia atlantica TaxID=2654982 RepID=UPI00160E313D|nr:hypothetical protein [Paraburkholderia atlantica]MBB5508139.1 hypothetical protein [Paraburkholderia atlantica]